MVQEGDELLPRPPGTPNARKRKSKSPRFPGFDTRQTLVFERASFPRTKGNPRVSRPGILSRVDSLLRELAVYQVQITRFRCTRLLQGLGRPGTLILIGGGRKTFSGRAPRTETMCGVGVPRRLMPRSLEAKFLWGSLCAHQESHLLVNNI